MQKELIALMSKALKVPSIPVELRKTREGWRAFMPSAITPCGGIASKSHVEITPGYPMMKTGLKMALARRYSAEVFPTSDAVFISPRFAMKNPRWSGRFGALPEFSQYMRRAGLI